MRNTLFLKEMKLNIKSISYLILVFGIIVFYITQYSAGMIYTEPVAGSNDYGTTPSDDPDYKMAAGISSLYGEYSSNSYACYPFGFYKNVRLNDSKQDKTAVIIEKIVGMDIESIEDKYGSKSITDTNTMQIEIPDTQSDIANDQIMTSDSQAIITDTQIMLTDTTIKSTVSYEEFLALMEVVDNILGGGSSYAEHSTSSFNMALRAMTYEEALEEYHVFINEDKVTNGYARLFCDYMVIILAILPIFPVTIVFLRDKKNHMSQLIYSKNISSFRLVVTKCLSLIVSILLPLLVLIIIATVQLRFNYPNAALDYLAFFKYTFGWLLPTILVTVGMGMFFATLCGNSLGVLIQGAWWYVQIVSLNSLVGYYGWNLMPRHNSITNKDMFIDGLGQLINNRILYTCVGILLILATVFIYDLKRKGRLEFDESVRKKLFNR